MQYGYAAAVNGPSFKMNKISCHFFQILYSVSIVDKTVYTVVAILSVALAFFGTIANVLVVTAYWRNRRLQTLQNFLLVVLAITDLPVTACLQPMLAIGVSVKNSCVFWDIYYTISVLFLNLSLVTTVILTLQTLITLAFPYRKDMITKARLKLAILFSWTLVVIFIVAAVITRNGSFASLGLISIGATTIFIVISSWLWICCLVRRHQNAIQSIHTPTTIVEGRKSLRPTLTVFIIISSFLFCYTLGLSFIIFAKSRSVEDDSRIPASLWSISTLLMHMNSFINPCLVFWRCSIFRETVVAMF